jgi:5-methylcytosine-specific restriction endonuclease McrA
MKICNGCKIEKPITEFYEKHNFCKKCKLEKNKKWKLENREKNIEKNYIHDNTEEGFVTRSISYLFCPSSIKDRGYTPESSKEEIKKHFYEYIEKYGKNCFYCKEPWTYLKTKVKMEKTVFKKVKRYPKNFSLDRLDNSKTYSVDNIVFCCAECNTSKNQISVKLIKRLYEIITERNL